MIWMHHETSSDSKKKNNHMQYWPIEVQRALGRHAGDNLIQWPGLQARLTLTITCTLRNCFFLTPAFITICSACTLGIGHWQKSNIDCLLVVLDFRRSRQELGGRLPVTNWAAVRRLPSGFNLFELVWLKLVHTINFKIWFFGGPKLQVSQNVVESALEGLWNQACSRKYGEPGCRSCRSSAESLSRSFLLRITLWRCSSIIEPEWQKRY